MRLITCFLWYKIKLLYTDCKHVKMITKIFTLSICFPTESLTVWYIRTILVPISLHVSIPSLVPTFLACRISPALHFNATSFVNQPIPLQTCRWGRHFMQITRLQASKGKRMKMLWFTMYAYTFLSNSVANCTHKLFHVQLPMLF